MSLEEKTNKWLIRALILFILALPLAYWYNTKKMDAHFSTEPYFEAPSRQGGVTIPAK